MNQIFYKYKLTSDAIHIGDRYKGGIFKPTIDYLRATTITFALRKYFNDDTIYAYGKKIFGIKKVMVRNIMDRANRTGKTTGTRGPIQVEIIENAQCEVIVNKKLDDEIEIKLGGFLNLGLGISKLKLIDEISNIQIARIKLESAIPIEWSNDFGIRNIELEIIGYLHFPSKDNPFGVGKYKKSYFPGTILYGPSFLGRPLN